MSTPTTIALLRPPGTTAAGTLVHETDCEVAVGETLTKELPEPEFCDLYVLPFVNQAIQQL